MLSQAQDMRQGPQSKLGDKGSEGLLLGAGGHQAALGRPGWGRPFATTENKEAGVARIVCGAEALSGGTGEGPWQLWEQCLLPPRQLPHVDRASGPGRG